jgi:hypothetical protein
MAGRVILNACTLGKIKLEAIADICPWVEKQVSGVSVEVSAGPIIRRHRALLGQVTSGEMGRMRLSALRRGR